MTEGPVPPYGLYVELRELIAQSRRKVASSINQELTLLYWTVGQRLHDHVLKGERADYGAGVLEKMGASLSAEFGRGFGVKNLRRMLHFFAKFPDSQIVSTLLRQLSWSHFLEILPIKADLAREFYAHKAVSEGWSVRELHKAIQAKTYERTALGSAQGEGLSVALKHYRSGGQLSPGMVFKDPYFLEFLGLPPGFDEKELENGILRELEAFILELGKGFAFVERQKRMVMDGEDFYLDLLFFHRRLRRLVAVELKLGRFKAAHKGQMELYLKWLDRHERQPGEEAPIGLILCAESSREQVELLEMHKDGIVVAEYLTELPPRKELELRLHTALVDARERLAARGALMAGEDEE